MYSKVLYFIHEIYGQGVMLSKTRLRKALNASFAMSFACFSAYSLDDGLPFGFPVSGFMSIAKFSAPSNAKSITLFPV